MSNAKMVALETKEHLVEVWMNFTSQSITTRWNVQTLVDGVVVSEAQLIRGFVNEQLTDPKLGLPAFITKSVISGINLTTLRDCGELKGQIQKLQAELTKAAGNAAEAAATIKDLRAAQAEIKKP